MIDELGPLLEGRYRIESELGHGGMALVFRAFDLRHDRAVALKVLRPELASAVSTQRFLAETRTSARMHHPHLLAVLDSGTAGPYLYYVMPLVEGGTLRRRLADGPPLSLEAIASLGAEIADALDYLHRQGQLHRDVKPENILLGEDHAYLADLGIARALEPARREFLTETGLTPGTARYMSPEQAAGDTRLDGRSDVYSLGVVLRECIEARKAPALRALLDRMAARRPEDRPRTAAAARDELRGLAPTGTTKPGRITQRRATWAIAAAVAAIFLAAAALRPEAERGGTGSTGDSLMIVLPFDVRGAMGAELRESVPSLLADALNGERVVRCREPRLVLDYARAKRLIPAEAGQRKALLRHFDSARYVAGEATTFGSGRIRIAARVVRSGPADSLLAAAVEEGPADSLSSVVDRLAVHLLAESNRSAIRDDLRAGNSRRSLAAIRAFLDGEAARLALDYEDAYRRYESAVRADSSFALAWMRLGQVSLYVSEDREHSTYALQRAVALSGNLSRRNRRMAEGQSALGRGLGAEARNAFQQMVDWDVTDAEALDALGFTISVFGKALGWDLAVLADIDQRLLTLDPMNEQSLRRAFDRAVRKRQGTTADSLLVRLERLNLTASDRVLFRVQALVAHGHEDEAFAIIRTSTDPTVRMQGGDAFLMVGDLEHTIAAWKLSDSPASADRARLYTRIRVSWAEMSRGRWSAAREQLALARELNPAIADLYQALMASALPRLDPAEITRARAALAGHDLSEERFAGMPAGSIYQQMEGSWTMTQRYALGLLDACAGRREAVRDASRELRGMRNDATDRAWSELYALGIEARLLATEGRSADALAVLERSSSQSQFGNRIGLRTLTLERFLRIQLLERLGRYEEANRWCRHFDSYWFDMIAKPEFGLIKARTLRALQREDQARSEYEAVLRRLDHPDSSYAPLVEEARDGIRALGSS